MATRGRPHPHVTIDWQRPLLGIQIVLVFFDQEQIGVVQKDSNGWWPNCGPETRVGSLEDAVEMVVDHYLSLKEVTDAD